jgi:hypothetical protein
MASAPSIVPPEGRLANWGGTDTRPKVVVVMPADRAGRTTPAPTAADYRGEADVVLAEKSR